MIWNRSSARRTIFVGSEAFQILPDRRFTDTPNSNISVGKRRSRRCRVAAGPDGMVLLPVEGTKFQSLKHPGRTNASVRSGTVDFCPISVTDPSPFFSTNLSSDGVPYLLFACPGLPGWNAFNSTLTKTSTCLVTNSQMISKVYFPRLILPLSTVFSTLIDFGVAFGLMVVLMLIHRVHAHTAFLLLPVWLAIILTLSVVLGLFTSALTVSYSGIQYVPPVMIQFLLYASPVAYAVSKVPDRY